MPRSNASFLGQLLGTSQKITASALDDSVSASLGGGSGVTAYATAAALPLSGNTVQVIRHLLAKLAGCIFSLAQVGIILH